MILESLDPVRVQGWEDMDEDQQHRYLDELYRAHILATIKTIPAQSPVLESRAKAGEISIVGAMYDVRSGEVDFFEAEDSSSAV